MREQYKKRLDYVYDRPGFDADFMLVSDLHQVDWIQYYLGETWTLKFKYNAMAFEEKVIENILQEAQRTRYRLPFGYELHPEDEL
ncbi:hypothetical protein, partial [Bacillus safensis]|uniref:hypothetical protein n=1 Tax=Bacillus safensis TaxID=561879 RepID=UPI0021510C52